ncbi:MAG: tyrosine-type recombinase/integrase [Planctomycetes bacterium]|nr:tyrosine-type recombinase/integrase [Planctomycetota bacterium]
MIAFVSWAERSGLTPDKRLSGLVPKQDENADRRKVRRALTDEELQCLVATAAKHDRAAWYLAAIHAGLRRGDLIALTWGDVDFDAQSLTIRDGKAKRPDVLPMHEQLAAALKAMRPATALPSARVFAAEVTNEMRRDDFLEAKIPLVDAEGRTADLHALRTTLGNALGASGDRAPARAASHAARRLPHDAEALHGPAAPRRGGSTREASGSRPEFRERRREERHRNRWHRHRAATVAAIGCCNGCCKPRTTRCDPVRPRHPRKRTTPRQLRNCARGCDFKSGEGDGT